MRLAVVLAVTGLGCGRVGFDAAAIRPAGDASDASADASPPSAGLVAWYRFDDGGGTTVTDSSGNGHDGGTIAGGGPLPTWGPGRFDGALSFDPASGDYVSVDESAMLVLAGSWTVSAWVSLSSIPAAGDAYSLVVKPNAASQHNYALFADHGFVGPGATGWVVAFHDGQGTEHFAIAPATFATGTWQHVAGAWDGTMLTLYVDGAAVATAVPGMTPQATTYFADGTPLSFMARNECCAQYLDGALDDVRIYDRALDAMEITSLYTAP